VGLRTAGLVAGSCLAVAATVVVFLTEDPRVLRLAVVAGAWAFVLAALVRSRSTADVSLPAREQLAAAEREAELRLAHELELEREAAARREHELRVVDDLRRTAEQSMRAELEALRTELTQVTELRREMGQLAELRGSSPASPSCAGSSPASPSCAGSSPASTSPRWPSCAPTSAGCAAS
jgi:hypothetical protein